jgi:hypothetical protein
LELLQKTKLKSWTSQHKLQLQSLSPTAPHSFFAARAAACSALDTAAAAQFLPLLADAEATEAVMQRHPLVRGCDL